MKKKISVTVEIAQTWIGDGFPLTKETIELCLLRGLGQWLVWSNDNEIKVNGKTLAGAETK